MHTLFASALLLAPFVGAVLLSYLFPCFPKPGQFHLWTPPYDG